MCSVSLKIAAALREEVEAIDGNVPPIALFAFDHELGQVSRAWRITAALGDYSNRQNSPCPRLAGALPTR
jgi:hypothetical protein